MLTWSAHAAGPAAVAKANTNLWPDQISSKESYDTASRAEILLFLSVYQNMFAAPVNPADLGVKSINQSSFDRWQERFKRYWLNTYLDAAQSCKSVEALGCGFKESDFEKLLSYSKQFTTTLPAQYEPWKTMSQPFYQIYLKEQARLAALFPNPTSEILPLAETEIIGDHFKDGEFLLTMDDGPTLSDDTEKYTKLLRENGISAFFFALGDGLEAKLRKTPVETLRQVYQGQCLASHGYQHKSHQKWTEWKSSLDKTRDLVHRITGKDNPVAFRPPYGQVQLSVINYLASQQAPVILWNIDSQDWQGKITPEEVNMRVKKLMLLWRKGIILFHDVHKKGFTAIPGAIQLGKMAGLRWVDCGEITMK